MTRLIEPFGGSLAVTMRLLGGEAPCSWPGSKRFYANAIIDVMGLTRPDELVLAEASPWYYVWQGLAESGWSELVEASRAVLVDGDEDAQKAAWLERRASFNPEALSAVEAGAMWLWLLKRSYSNKGPQAGFSPRKITLGPRSNFGKWRYRVDDPWYRLDRMQLGRLPEIMVFRRAEDIPLELISGSNVYVDPPYPDTTPYAWGTAVPLEDLGGLVSRWSLAKQIGVSLHIEHPDLLAHGFVRHELPRRERPGRNRSKQQLELLMVRA